MNNITLQTIQNFTKQEIFDFIVGKLIEQGSPSIDKGISCLYRGPNGLKCAIGHIMPDESHSLGLEGKSVDGVANHLKLIIREDVHKQLRGFLSELQCIHDSCSNHQQTINGCKWSKLFFGRLVGLAKKYDLTYKFEEQANKYLENTVLLG
jgi:hypothetical protein